MFCDYRDVRYVDRVEYNVQVQLRFCLIDSSCRQPDCFPSSINVKVNNMPATLPVCHSSVSLVITHYKQARSMAALKHSL